MSDISSALEAILFAAGECVPLARLSLILMQKIIISAAAVIITI